MLCQTVLTIALAGLASAQFTTKAAFLPMADKEALDASVMGVADGHTTYVFNCRNPEDKECNFPKEGSYTAIEGPETVAFGLEMPKIMGDKNEFYMRGACSLKGDSDALCIMEMAADGTTEKETTSLTDRSEVSALYRPLTITAGAELLTQGDAAPTGPGSDSAGLAPTASVSGDAPQQTGDNDDEEGAGSRLVGGPVVFAAAAVAGALLM